MDIGIGHARCDTLGAEGPPSKDLRGQAAQDKQCRLREKSGTHRGGRLVNRVRNGEMLIVN